MRSDLLRVLLVSLAVLGFSFGPSLALDSLPPQVERALGLLETANSQVPRFSYDRQTYKKGIKTEFKSFAPLRPVATRWQVVFPSTEDDAKEHRKLQEKYAKWDGNSDKALLITNLRDRMQGGAKLLRTEDQLDVFGFDISDDYFLEGGGRKSEISQKINGEIAIDTNTNAIRWIRYYAPQGFKPLSIVKINQYEIVQHIAPAWAGGPWVRVYETSKVLGSAPFTRIHVDEVMINENFVPVVSN